MTQTSLQALAMDEKVDFRRLTLFGEPSTSAIGAVVDRSTATIVLPVLWVSLTVLIRQVGQFRDESVDIIFECFSAIDTNFGSGKSAYTVMDTPAPCRNTTT